MAPWERSIVGLACVGAFLAPAAAHGQIRTDGTLGAAQTLGGPNFAIPASLGRQAGANLFHSFAHFGIPTGGSATFSGPNSVGNIISRVTGADASSIDGRLASSIAGANLFLINPKGILFGPKASLDLTGSFYASTANYLRLADGTRFDATATTPAVLSTAPPAAFGFLGPSAAPITVQASSLQPGAGRAIALVGGSVDLRGAIVRSFGADVGLVSAASAGEIAADSTALPSPGTILGDVKVTASQIRTNNSGALAPGRIVIRGGRITVTDNSIVRSQNASGADAMPVLLSAAGELKVSASQVYGVTTAAGRGADLVLIGDNVTADRNSQVVAWSTGSGRGGDVDISARNAVRIVAAAADPNYTTVYSIASGTAPSGAIRVTGDSITIASGNLITEARLQGDAGPISLRGRIVQIHDGAWVLTQVYPGASGRGGDIDIAATERFYLSGLDWNGASAAAFTRTWGDGNAGNIRVAAPDLHVNGGAINSVTYAAGNAGSMAFNGDVIRFHGGNGNFAFIDTTAKSGSTGNGGNIDVRATTSLEVSRAGYPQDWTRLATSTFSVGRGGDITVEAPRITVRDGASIWAATFGSGRGGDVRLRVHDLSVFEAGSIQSLAEGRGRGGDIVVEGTGRLNLPSENPRSEFGIFSDTAGPGRGGDVRINVPLITAEQSARIRALTFGPGDAGDINVNATRIAVTGDASFEATAFGGSGNAGTIRIEASESIEFGQRIWFWYGGIYSRAQGSGDAGRIYVSTPRLTMDDARIQVTAYYFGNGGEIDVRTDRLILANGAQIDARTLAGSTGNAGAIRVVASERLEIYGISPVDGAFSGINAQTGGSGTGGDIRIAAGDVVLDRGFVKSTTGGDGNAGSIDVLAQTVRLGSGARIDASAALGSSGTGGSISVNATESILVTGVDSRPEIQWLRSPDVNSDAVIERGRPQGPAASAIATSTAGEGDGGRITLSAPRIDIVNGGRVEAISAGTGAAGSIGISAPDALHVFGDSKITTQALLSDGGNIDIRAGNRVHLKDSEISTSVGSGEGGGGNIFIDPTFVILENSRIIANAFGGPGGNIRIVADYFLSSPGSVIDASSRLGTSGSVQIAALNTNLDSELAALPTQVLDGSAMLRDSCGARLATGRGSSSLVGVGRGGLAASPERFAAANYFAGEDARSSSAEATPSPTGLKLVTAQRARLIVGCAS